MKAFIKSFSSFRTQQSADVISATLCLASSDDASSKMVVAGELPYSFVGSWVVFDKMLYFISKVAPQDGLTELTLTEPINVFSRALEYSTQDENLYIGGWIAQVISQQWVSQPDKVYAIPYLNVSNSDTTPFVAPDLDGNGLFCLDEYIRKVRLTYNVRVNFSVKGDSLTCSIYTGTTQKRNIIFDDGHSQLSAATYSASTLAKITAIQQIDTGATDADGNKIYGTTSVDYYLTEAGTATTRVPDIRVSGDWDTIFVGANANVEETVLNKFAQNSKSHKIEFYADREFEVYDPCNIKLYGEIMSSYISYKGISTTDNRYFYKSGELATTVTDKIRSLMP